MLCYLKQRMISLSLLREIYPTPFWCTCALLHIPSPTQRSALARDREKEKSVEFANGSLLRSDSRIFVQHPGAFPLFRTRFSRFLLLPLSPCLPRIAPSAHFSFSKFSYPETPTYFILLTFYFALSRFFLFFPSLCPSPSWRFVFSCSHFKFLFPSYRPSFYNNSVSILIIMPLYVRRSFYVIFISFFPQFRYPFSSRCLVQSHWELSVSCIVNVSS